MLPPSTGLPWTRTIGIAAAFLGQKGYRQEDILAVQNMIRCTGVDALLSEIRFQSELERTVGFALGTDHPRVDWSPRPQQDPPT